MEEYSQAQAYKRLLQIAESILSSTQTDANIIQKYQKLKGAMLAKITSDPSTYQLSYLRKMLQSYKYVTSSLIEVIAEFESQIEEGMERASYNKKVIGIVKQWQLRLDQLKKGLNDDVNQKQKLIFKEEVSALTYYCSELDSKLENLGLLIEVHKKMHQIICQASKSQVEKGNREQQLTVRLRQLQREVRRQRQQMKQVRNGKKFIQKHGLSEQSYKHFKMWSSKLEKLLFQH